MRHEHASEEDSAAQAPPLAAALAPAGNSRELALARRLLEAGYGNAHVTRTLARHDTAPPAVTKGGSAKAAATVKWADVEALLKKAPFGIWALKVYADKKVTMATATAGPPAYFLPSKNEVTLNMALRKDIIAAYFVHEMYHASQFHGGRSPEATTMGKDEWVKKLVQEEIDGTAAGFDAKREWENSGDAPKDDEPPGMGFYRGAYEHGYKEALKEGKSEDEAVKAGRRNGARMVRILIAPTDGTWARLAPNSYETYTMYYEREWKQANKPKAAVTP